MFSQFLIEIRLSRLHVLMWMSSRTRSPPNLSSSVTWTTNTYDGRYIAFR